MTKRRARSPARSTKAHQTARRAEEAVCAVCGKFYPTHDMSWHLVERLHDGHATLERVGLCRRDAEKVVAGERAHLRHIAHEGSKTPDLHVARR